MVDDKEKVGGDEVRLNEREWTLCWRVAVGSGGEEVKGILLESGDGGAEKDCFRGGGCLRCGRERASGGGDGDEDGDGFKGGEEDERLYDEWKEDWASVSAAKDEEWKAKGGEGGGE